MAGAPVEDPGVNVGTGSAGEAFEEIVDQLGLEITYKARADFGIDYGGGASAEIDGGHSHGFVHRHEEISGAQNAALGAEGLVEGLAEDDTDIFDGVVLIDVEITAGFELEVEASVMSEEFEHVVEETDAGGDVVTAATFDG